RATPFGGIEWLAPGAVGFAPAHEAGLRVEEVGVVHGLAGKLLGLGGAANGAGELRGAEGVVGVFEGLGRGFGEAGFPPDAGVRDIALLIVILGAVAPNGAAVVRSLGVGVVHHSGQGLLGVKAADALGPAVGQEREGVIADHAGAVAGTRPWCEPAALV